MKIKRITHDTLSSSTTLYFDEDVYVSFSGQPRSVALRDAVIPDTAEDIEITSGVLIDDLELDRSTRRVLQKLREMPKEVIMDHRATGKTHALLIRALELANRGLDVNVVSHRDRNAHDMERQLRSIVSDMHIADQDKAFLLKHITVTANPVRSASAYLLDELFFMEDDVLRTLDRSRVYGAVCSY